MEAFARAVQRSRSFSEADNPEAWLRRVAVNVARSRWRRLVRFHALARYSRTTVGTPTCRRTVWRSSELCANCREASGWLSPCITSRTFPFPR
jgi:DNA-directed RNA polymerase specialized sigma24 family protein